MEEKEPVEHLKDTIYGGAGAGAGAGGEGGGIQFKEKGAMVN